LKLRRVVAAVATAGVLLAVTAFAATAPAARQRVVVAHAAEDESGGPDKIAGLLFDFAKDPAKEFVFRQLGLATNASRIETLSRKIDALSVQLTGVESRLSTQIAALALQTRLDYLQDQIADLRTLLNKYFIPVVASVVKVKVAEERRPRDQAVVDKALDEYQDQKDAFLRYADSKGIGSIAGNIHNRLQPSTGEGVLRQLGAVVMAKNRILTAGDSASVISLYTALEENQALATWMEVERAYAVGGSSVNTVKPTLDDFFRWKNEQRDANRPNGLLPPIPAGVAIDRGPDTSTTSYTTVGKPMFAYGGKGYAFAPFPITWVWSAPDTVQAAVSRANGAKLLGFSGWGVPSKAQIAGLFSNLKTFDRLAILNYVHALLGGAVARPPFEEWFWTTDTTTKQWCHAIKKKGRPYTRCEPKPVHIGVSTSNLGGYPYPSTIGSAKLHDVYRQYLGGLLLVRTSDRSYL
jgi:hypothetical protein